MNLKLAQLCERVAAEAGFSAVEQVGDSIIRSIRRSGETPFAVYYFDVSQILPENQAKLTKYQDQVIGNDYFKGNKSLQWSNYLYFITSSDWLARSGVHQTKEFIECDRNYARKFVISEEELESVLKPRVVAPSDSVPQHSILSVWTDLLAKAHLDKAILSDDDLPTRLELIEASVSTDSIRPSPVRPHVKIEAVPFIRSLNLKKFRNPPLQRDFEFGTVNLLFGSNGSGKTSLLEAIELFYCGRNKRNPNEALSYEFLVKLYNDQIINVNESRKTKDFRERNLSWYGQAEVKTNDLYLSFAQFNFLDTDAAVSLADSTSRIEEDLSKLLVGADASKTWRNIERVDDTIIAKLRDLHRLLQQFEEELVLLRRRIEEVSGVKQESDSISVRLEEMIKRLGWGGGYLSNASLANSIVEPLSELESLAQQAISLGWTESPASIDGLAKYSLETKVNCENFEAQIGQLEKLRINEKRFADKCKRARESLSLAEQVKSFINAGLPILTEKVKILQNTVTKYAGCLVGFNENATNVYLTMEQDIGLDKCCNDARLKRSLANALLISTKREYENFCKLREESLNLAQKLRETAARILQFSPKPDECPLCHTPFGPGELVININKGVDEHLEALGQTLLAQLQDQEDKEREAIAVENTVDWLSKFCKRACLVPNITFNLALVEVENAKRTLTDARNRLETLNNELITLEAQGISMTKFEDTCRHLRDMGYSLGDCTIEAVDQLLASINDGLENSSRTFESERKQAEQLQETLAIALGGADFSVQGFKKSLSQLKERCVTAESLRVKLLNFSSSFPWSGERPLAELAVETGAIRKVAADLQAVQGRERQAKTVYNESIKREEQVKNQHVRLCQRIKRLSEAQLTLQTIRNKHSLAGAMEAALRKNRAGIETIFSRIHSPADFCGLGPNLTTLIRKLDNQEAKLSQISTGQRAAFALSIFLAQNAQLKFAPPVVLIDDPIAHVDDLNSLSFFDYLRDVVLTGRRQIFFATANNKLATLFERKFDFLGEKGFRRFNLYRGPS